MLSAPRPVLLTDQSTRSLTRDMCILCGLRHAIIQGLCFLSVVRAKKISETTGMGIDIIWDPKFQGNRSMARRRISIWRYTCCSESILGVCVIVQNKVLRTTGNFPRRTLVGNLHTAFKLQYIYDYITKLCMQQAEVIRSHEDANVHNLDKVNPDTANIRGLNLAAIKPYDRSSD
jgi:hypothetical protein